MTSAPQFAHEEVGAVVSINGRPMRHLGGGRFEPLEQGEGLFKRYDMDEGDTLHSRRAA